MFLCGKCCLLPKHALYLVKQELQRKTSKTIFIFLLVGVKSALKKYLSCLPHFCYILVSEPVYNFEGRRMAAVYNVGEVFSATHLLSYSIIRPNFPKYNFNSESCSKFPTLPFFFLLDNQAVQLTFSDYSQQKHPITKLVHLYTFLILIQLVRITFI